MDVTPAQLPSPRKQIARVPKPPTVREDRLDHWLHAAQGHATFGVSPLGLGLAFQDWAAHMANAPFHCVSLARAAVTQCQRAARAAGGDVEISPPPGEHRFAHPAWRRQPFSFYAQAFLLAEQWWDLATAGPEGINRANQRVVSFTTRQLVDVFSPSNQPWLNPEVLEATRASKGWNLWRGATHWLTDLQEALTGHPVESGGLVVGRDLAATPGKVVFRNQLIELIQYAPTTSRVAREPVLIIPAWIMKYYILDLSPHNSLIRHLVAQGHTVFAISWRNPGPSMRGTSFEDYRVKGVMAALDAVGSICGKTKVHACGYCLGGTLLAITAAAMARDGDDRLAGVTLFCAQIDFSEAGELQLFITEDQLSFLEDLMRAQGYLDSRQMAGAFQLLRSNDLVWSRAIRSYFIGEREHPNDLMTWNADGTRLPARMQSEYLRRLFLNDDLAHGRFPAGGHPVSVGDIRVPLFVVATETDHIAPWRSVYKIHLLNEGDLTFVLTTGGHNAGVVSEPSHAGRRYHIGHRLQGTHYLGPDEWLAGAEACEGSWWPAWWAWLDALSSERADPPPMGSRTFPPLMDAPGRYVHEH